jgi:hypothetical protein
MLNSTILTISLSQEAPTGQYTFEINTEGSVVTQADGNTKPLGSASSGTFGLMIIVVPKANS